MEPFQDFLSLFYPRICVVCGNSLVRNEEILCTYCKFKLPKTNFHLIRDNPVNRLFWGRVQVEAATALLHFFKGGQVQRLMHHLKYKNRKDVGVFLGKLLAMELKKSFLFTGLDIIVPVPLHPRKQKIRGFNQSELICRGLSQALNLELNTGDLQRIKHVSSQTRKSRYDRWLNVGEVFAVKDPLALSGKHILLVDDVVTTGATLEACVAALRKNPQTKVSIATIAFTN